jgi:dolichyl-phosphate-mannose--protein O-mannosyl transferase
LIQLSFSLLLEFRRGIYLGSLFQQRTVFTFYAIVFEPFLILALVYCARSILTNYGRNGEIAVAATFIVLFFNFLYFMPIYLGDVMTYDAWHARMWFASWI